jgi:hypothetical protein
MEFIPEPSISRSDVMARLWLQRVRSASRCLLLVVCIALLRTRRKGYFRQDQDETDLRGTARGIAYARVTQSYEAITEFRGKLLALLPLATGTGAFLLLQKEDTPQNRQLLGPLGLLGFTVTVGLFAYELRGMQRCSRLEVQAYLLEKDLGLGKEGPFKGQPDRSLGGMLGPPLAGLVVYISTALTWLYIAGVGLDWSILPSNTTTTVPQPTTTLTQPTTTEPQPPPKPSSSWLVRPILLYVGRTSSGLDTGAMLAT